VGGQISAPQAAIGAPTLTQLGGVFLPTYASNQFLTGIDSFGNVSAAQVLFSNLGGQITNAQIGFNAVQNSNLVQVPAATLATPVSADVSFPVPPLVLANNASEVITPAPLLITT